jgi:hypothetical protein
MSYTVYTNEGEAPLSPLVSPTSLYTTLLLYDGTTSAALWHAYDASSRRAAGGSTAGLRAAAAPAWDTPAATAPCGSSGGLRGYRERHLHLTAIDYESHVG